MKIGMELLVGNIPSICLAAMAVFLITQGQSPWVWAWFLALAAYNSIHPK